MKSGLVGTVTAIIPTFNRAHFLAEALDGVIDQGDIIGQIIVCDDGSTDDTSELVRTLGHDLQYLYQPNAGKSAALNHALKHATGRFIWIVDDDDVALPDKVRLLAEALQDNPQAGFAYGRAAALKEEGGQPVITPFHAPMPDSEDPFIANLLWHRVLHEACLFRSEVIARTGPFDSQLLRSLDWDYTLRVATCFAGVYVPERIFLQRDHDGQRGARADRFAAAQKSQKWGAYDRRVIGKLLREVPPSRFSLVPQADTGRMLASAYLVRAVTAMRKAVWEEARHELKTFVELANSMPGLVLTASERHFLNRSYGSHSQLFGKEASQQDVFGPLAGLEDGRVLAALRGAIQWALLKFCLRHVRRGELAKGKASLGLMLQLARLRSSPVNPSKGSAIPAELLPKVRSARHRQ